MACCHKCLKYMVTLLNFIYMGIGVAILTIALWVFFGKLNTNVTASTTFFLYFLMCLGTSMFLIGSLGCLGALKGNRHILTLFCTLAIIVIIVEITVVVWMVKNDQHFITANTGTNDLVKHVINLTDKIVTSIPYCCGSQCYTQRDINSILSCYGEVVACCVNHATTDCGKQCIGLNANSFMGSIAPKDDYKSVVFVVWVSSLIGIQLLVLILAMINTCFLFRIADFQP